MAAPARDPKGKLAIVLAALQRSVGATRGRALSTEAVLAGGKIAAFMAGGRLVVKLPPQRVAELIASGEAAPMRMGNRTMRAWVSLAPSTDARWIAVAEESARYVVAGTPEARKSRAAVRTRRP